jgi:hypothetical protein
MPAIPLILSAGGVFSAMGTAIASAIGLGTVSAAAATAIGAGTWAALHTASEGGDASATLKAAVSAGINSYAGSAISSSIAGSVSADLAKDGLMSKGLADAFGKVAGGSASGAITSSLNALLTGKDPADALIKGGLAGGMGAAVTLGVDYVLKDVPGFSAPANNAEAAFQRAVKSSLGAAISSGGDMSKVRGALINSFVSSAGNYFKDFFKDNSGDLSAANAQFRESERDYTNNLEQQNKVIESYNKIAAPVIDAYKDTLALKEDYEKAASHYDQVDTEEKARQYLASQGYQDGDYFRLPDGNVVSAFGYSNQVRNQVEDSVRVLNEQSQNLNNQYVRVFGGRGIEVLTDGEGNQYVQERDFPNIIKSTQDQLNALKNSRRAT